MFDRTAVLAVEPANERVVLRTDRQHVIDASHVVVATGYETAEFLELRVAELVSTYAFASEPLSETHAHVLRDLIVWEHADPYMYLRTTPDGRIIVGGEDEPFRNAMRRDRLLEKKTNRLVERFKDLVPDVELDVAFAWAGTFGETPDGLAYIGPHRKVSPVS